MLDHSWLSYVDIKKKLIHDLHTEIFNRWKVEIFHRFSFSRIFSIKTFFSFCIKGNLLSQKYIDTHNISTPNSFS